MSVLNDPLPLGSGAINPILVTALLAISYILCTAIYRLYFSPLSAIPGPRLAGTKAGSKRTVTLFGC